MILGLPSRRPGETVQSEGRNARRLTVVYSSICDPNYRSTVVKGESHDGSSLACCPRAFLYRNGGVIPHCAVDTADGCANALLPGCESIFALANSPCRTPRRDVREAPTQLRGQPGPGEFGSPL